MESLSIIINKPIDGDRRASNLAANDGASVPDSGLVFGVDGSSIVTVSRRQRQIRKSEGNNIFTTTNLSMESQRVLAWDVEAQRSLPWNMEDVVESNHNRTLSLSLDSDNDDVLVVSRAAAEPTSASSSFRWSRPAVTRAFEQHGATVKRKHAVLEELRAVLLDQCHNRPSVVLRLYHLGKRIHTVALQVDANGVRLQRALEEAHRVRSETAAWEQVLHRRRMEREAEMEEHDEDGSDWYFEHHSSPSTSESDADSLAYSEDSGDGLDFDFDQHFGNDVGRNHSISVASERSGTDVESVTKLHQTDVIHSSSPSLKSSFRRCLGFLLSLVLALPLASVHFDAKSEVQPSYSFVQATSRGTALALRASDSSKQVALIPIQDSRVQVHLRTPASAPKCSLPIVSMLGSNLDVWGGLVPRYAAMVVRTSDNDKQLLPYKRIGSDGAENYQVALLPLSSSRLRYQAFTTTRWMQHSTALSKLPEFVPRPPSRCNCWIWAWLRFAFFQSMIENCSSSSKTLVVRVRRGAHRKRRCRQRKRNRDRLIFQPALRLYLCFPCRAIYTSRSARRKRRRRGRPPRRHLWCWIRACWRHRNQSLWWLRRCVHRRRHPTSPTKLWLLRKWTRWRTRQE
jgi:hypothetical protein